MKLKRAHIKSLEKVGGDVRGSVFKLSLDSKDFLLLEMRKGSFRGGHYHDRKTVHIVLSGQIRFEFYDLSTRKKTEEYLESMQVVDIPPGIAHLLEALDESLFMEPLDEDRVTVVYEEQRKRVKEYLESSKH